MGDRNLKEWVAIKLANWATDLRPDELPAEVLAKAEDCIIDAIASAIPGGDADGARRVHAVAKGTYRDAIRTPVSFTLALV